MVAVHYGVPTLCALKERVINVTIANKFEELRQNGQIPICLFPLRKQCNQFNKEMLDCLPSKKHEIYCIDEVDETCSIQKWTKKAAEQLKKLNNDCDMTAGLEAILTLAVGARVMLRRNIDTAIGLVNGALGTILAIAPTHITVMFDHMTTTYDVFMVKSKFVLMKNFYVYHKQFPIILAFAVTIHKCQGLFFRLCHSRSVR